MNRLILPPYAVAAVAVGVAFYRSTPIDDGVYAPPADYRFWRSYDAEGRERVYMNVNVIKAKNCDLEGGSGPVWAEFFDPKNVGVLPNSPVYDENGNQPDKTIGKAGDHYELKGWSAKVPPKAREGDGWWVIYVPCQIWTTNADGEKDWGRKVYAKFGPLPLPKRGHTIIEADGKPGDLIPLYDERD